MRSFIRLGFAFGIVVACGGSTSTTDGGTSGDGSVSGDLFSCGAAGECDIRPKSCCGSCGTPTPADMIGINWQKGSAYSSSMCQGVGCPGCAGDPDPNLAPVCRMKTCNAIDVRADVIGACTMDQDCRLRFAGCCEFCPSADPKKLIAIAVTGNAEYTANQCHPDQGGCPKCAVMYPPGYAARCNPTTKHCEVVSGILDAGTD